MSSVFFACRLKAAKLQEARKAESEALAAGNGAKTGAWAAELSFKMF